MSEKSFNQGFGNALTGAQKPQAYREFIVPAPGRIFFQALLGKANQVRWDNPARPPLLFIVGSVDKTVTPAMVKSNYK